jgi:hypothetical protein
MFCSEPHAKRTLSRHVPEIEEEKRHPRCAQDRVARPLWRWRALHTITTLDRRDLVLVEKLR